MLLISFISLFLGLLSQTDGRLLPGKTTYSIPAGKSDTITSLAYLYNQTSIIVKVICDADSGTDGTVYIDWVLHHSNCVTTFTQDLDDISATGSDPNLYLSPSPCRADRDTDYVKPDFVTTFNCASSNVHLDDFSDLKQQKYPSCLNSTKGVHSSHKSPVENSIARSWKDGSYLLVISVDTQKSATGVSITVEFKDEQGGHLSALNWPLLPFWACMCTLYTVVGLIWLFLSVRYLKDILRLQLWISAVLFLGMVESSVFLAEVDSVNSSGKVSMSMLIFGEFVSAFKRSLARMLVIIVSLGYGIVKPRLGEVMIKVIILGGCFFVCAMVEGYLQVTSPRFAKNKQIAAIPLAIIDAIVCYWIFYSLLATLRSLKLRGNHPKYSLYRHFTNVLVFCVASAVGFMIWSLRVNVFADCPEWSQLWLDDAYWPLLFTIILMVICILFRPSNSSIRYAYSPLLDGGNASGDEEDDEDEIALYEAPIHATEAFGDLKLRKVVVNSNGDAPQKNDGDNDEEDDEKWIEENLPSSDAVLHTALDSDDEAALKTEMEKIR